MSAAALKNTSAVISAIAGKVTDWTGNRFLEKHYAMIESRLTRRILQLKIPSIEEYYKYINEHEDDEKEHLIALLTTHHTYFFRESSHFDFIRTNVLKQLVKEISERPDKTIRILSMACSKGHEVYSLATYLDYHLKDEFPGLDYKITATDVDALSVNYAINGVYPFDELKRVPMQYLEGYWVRGKGEISNFAKISKSIQSKCEFYPENLLNISERTRAQSFDIILCRNVFIYFDQVKIKEITSSLLNLMKPSGYLIVGISENLRGTHEGVIAVGPSVYRKKEALLSTVTGKVLPMRPNLEEKQTAQSITRTVPQPIRVLCVDDSPTIHTILDKILTEKEGFKIVGKALNGIEAIEFLKNNSVDAITLDIHMPVMTGIEFLEKNSGGELPPVVMMTSVTRENSDLAFKALSLGARDYVEKPTLQNMKEIAGELTSKLKTAVGNAVHFKMKKAFDRQFAKNLQVRDAKECLNVIFGSIGEREKIKELIHRSYTLGIETLVLLTNAKNEDGSIVGALFQQWGILAAPYTLNAPEKVLYSFDLKNAESAILHKAIGRTRVVTSVTDNSSDAFFKLNLQPPGKVIIEEGQKLDIRQVKRGWNVYPFTSMEYTIFENFAK
jgi:chemotaxis protein methyltransferase CheR